MTKALFFDIDGTLVSFETHRIPSSTIEALEAARAKGLKIFIATGRPKAIINNLSELQDRNLIDGYITMNGAYCFVGEQVIYKSAIPQDEVKAMGDFCEKKGVPSIFVEEHNISVCQPNDMVKKIFYDFLHVNVIPTVSFEEAHFRLLPPRLPPQFRDQKNPATSQSAFFLRSFLLEALC